MQRRHYLFLLGAFLLATGTVQAATIDTITLDPPYRVGSLVNVSVTAQASPRANLTITLKDTRAQPVATVTYTGLESRAGTVSGVLQHQISAAANQGDWLVEARVTANGSTGSSSKTFAVQGQRRDTVFLSFPHLTHGAALSKTGRFPIEIRVENASQHAVTNADIRCRFHDDTEIRLQHRGNGSYTGVYTSDAAPGYGILRCSATQERDGTVYTGENTRILASTLNLLQAEITAPTTFPTGETMVNTSLTWDGEPVTDATAWIVEDGERTGTQLRHTGNGVYTVRFTPAENTKEISVDAAANQVVTRSTPLTSSGGTTLYILIGVVAVLVVVIGILLAVMETGSTTEEAASRGVDQVEPVLQDIEDVIGRIRSLQRQYSRGEVDDDTFTRLLEQYQRDKERAAAKLSEVREQLPPSEEDALRTVELRILAEDLKNLAERLEIHGASTYPEVVKLDRVIDNLGDSLPPDAAADQLSIIEDTLHGKQEDQDTEAAPEQPSATEAARDEPGEAQGKRGGGETGSMESLITEIEDGITRLRKEGVDVDAFEMRLEDLKESYSNGADVSDELAELQQHVEDRELYEGLKDMEHQ